MLPDNQQKYKTVFGGSFNRNLSWYTKTFVPIVISAVKEFWEVDVKCRLMGVFDNGTNVFKGEELFVTKVPIKTDKLKNAQEYVLVKLSKELCKDFLEKALGKNDFDNFQFDRMTELEFNVISGFNAAIGKEVQSAVPESDVELQESSYDLLFYIKTSDGTSGKIVVSVPYGLFKPQDCEIKEFEFNINSFANTKTTVSITVGKTKSFLRELKSLERGDVVVLEESRLNKMTLHVNGETTEIRVNPDPALIFSTNEDEEQIMNGKLSKDMWDTIQVEIGAEFDKIKITLGELRQISEGLVVDIGSVYKNKISLKVENKTIANGELVIIDDRYGVRIDEVFKQPDEIAEVPNQKDSPKIKTRSLKTKMHEEEEEEDILDDELNEENIEDEDFEEEDEEELEDEDEELEDDEELEEDEEDEDEDDELNNDDEDSDFDVDDDNI